MSGQGIVGSIAACCECQVTGAWDTDGCLRRFDAASSFLNLPFHPPIQSQRSEGSSGSLPLQSQSQLNNLPTTLPESLSHRDQLQSSLTPSGGNLRLQAASASSHIVFASAASSPRAPLIDQTHIDLTSTSAALTTISLHCQGERSDILP